MSDVQMFTRTSRIVDQEWDADWDDVNKRYRKPTLIQWCLLLFCRWKDVGAPLCMPYGLETDGKGMYVYKELHGVVHQIVMRTWL